MSGPYSRVLLNIALDRKHQCFVFPITNEFPPAGPGFFEGPTVVYKPMEGPILSEKWILSAQRLGLPATEVFSPSQDVSKGKARLAEDGGSLARDPLNGVGTPPGSPGDLILPSPNQGSLRALLRPHSTGETPCSALPPCPQFNFDNLSSVPTTPEAVVILGHPIEQISTLPLVGLMPLDRIPIWLPDRVIQFMFLSNLTFPSMGIKVEFPNQVITDLQNLTQWILDLSEVGHCKASTNHDLVTTSLWNSHNHHEKECYDTIVELLN